MVPPVYCSGLVLEDAACQLGPDSGSVDRSASGAAGDGSSLASGKGRPPPNSCRSGHPAGFSYYRRRQAATPLRLARRRRTTSEPHDESHEEGGPQRAVEPATIQRRRWPGGRGRDSAREVVARLRPAAAGDSVTGAALLVFAGRLVLLAALSIWAAVRRLARAGWQRTRASQPGEQLRPAALRLEMAVAGSTGRDRSRVWPGGLSRVYFAERRRIAAKG